VDVELFDVMVSLRFQVAMTGLPSTEHRRAPVDGIRHTLAVVLKRIANALLAVAG